jgi:hypothetical protein
VQQPSTNRGVILEPDTGAQHPGGRAILQQPAASGLCASQTPSQCAEASGLLGLGKCAPGTSCSLSVFYCQLYLRERETAFALSQSTRQIWKAYIPVTELSAACRGLSPLDKDGRSRRVEISGSAEASVRLYPSVHILRLQPPAVSIVKVMLGDREMEVGRKLKGRPRGRPRTARAGEASQLRPPKQVKP